MPSLFKEELDKGDNCGLYNLFGLLIKFTLCRMWDKFATFCLKWVVCTLLKKKLTKGLARQSKRFDERANIVSLHFCVNVFQIAGMTFKWAFEY